MSGDLFEESTPATDDTCLGLELFYNKAEPLGTPLDCFVMVKTMAADGEVGWRLLSSENLNSMEAFGAIRWAEKTLEAEICFPGVTTDESNE
jgi:hypothetical protein